MLNYISTRKNRKVQYPLLSLKSASCNPFSLLLLESNYSKQQEVGKKLRKGFGFSPCFPVGNYHWIGENARQGMSGACGLSYLRNQRLLGQCQSLSSLSTLKFEP